MFNLLKKNINKSGFIFSKYNLLKFCCTQKYSWKSFAHFARGLFWGVGMEILNFPENQ